VKCEALSCSLCSKIFRGRNKRQNLNFHMMIHSGTKPHKCPYCSHRSTFKSNVTKHVSRIHPEKLPISQRSENRGRGRSGKGALAGTSLWSSPLNNVAFRSSSSLDPVSICEQNLLTASEDLAGSNRSAAENMN
ncbi:Zinc finger C2H2-type, partial [Trinorchestia longiramus]